MRKIEGYDAINENGELKTLTPGIYGLVIKNVVDVPEKNYLEVYFDIAKGEFKDYYSIWAASDGKDHSKTVRSYTQNAMVFFKRFITSVEKSNPGFSWDWDEKKLIGKFVVGEFGEEEYVTNEGKLGVFVRLQNFRSVEAFKNGDCKIPERKTLTEQEKARLVPDTPVETIDEIEESLPF